MPSLRARARPTINKPMRRRLFLVLCFLLLLTIAGCGKSPSPHEPDEAEYRWNELQAPYDTIYSTRDVVITPHPEVITEETEMLDIHIANNSAFAIYCYYGGAVLCKLEDGIWLYWRETNPTPTVGIPPEGLYLYPGETAVVERKVVELIPPALQEAGQYWLMIHAIIDEAYPHLEPLPDSTRLHLIASITLAHTTSDD